MNQFSPYLQFFPHKEVGGMLWTMYFPEIRMTDKCGHIKPGDMGWLAHSLLPAEKAVAVERTLVVLYLMDRIGLSLGTWISANGWVYEEHKFIRERLGYSLTSQPRKESKMSEQEQNTENQELETISPRDINLSMEALTPGLDVTEVLEWEGKFQVAVDDEYCEFHFRDLTEEEHQQVATLDLMHPDDPSRGQEQPEMEYVDGVGVKIFGAKWCRYMLGELPSNEDNEDDENGS